MSSSEMASKSSQQVTMTKEDIMEMYPLHYMVWEKDEDGIEAFLKEHPNHGAMIDNHGRTPLMLAIALFHKKAALLLAKHNHELVVTPDRDGFTPWHEAITTCDTELLHELYKIKEERRCGNLLKSIEATFSDFSKVPDFYYEMKMQFNSWVPFLAHFCPVDTYKVYKHGAFVRIDTTLVAIDESRTFPKAIKGSRSFVFICGKTGTTYLDMDHETKTYVKVGYAIGSEKLEKKIIVNDEKIKEKIKQPVKYMWVDGKNAVMKRATKGFFNPKERTDEISGYICRVFHVNEIYVHQRVRTEHLGFKGSLDDINNNRNPNGVTVIEYFNASDPKELKEKDIGLPRNIKEYKNHFKADVWMSEEFPMSVNIHLMPVLNLMSLLNPHFQRLLHFFNSISQPKGFPVQLEVPVFFPLNAVVTFGNVYASKTPVEGVKSKQLDEGGTQFSCEVDKNLFVIPPEYNEFSNNIE